MTNETGKTIDCLFIGHNEMSFFDYEGKVKEMGTNSGAYRDLSKNFLLYNTKPYHASEVFNLFCRGEENNTPAIEPLNIGETFNLAIAYLGTWLHRRGMTFDFVNSFQDEKEELAEKLRRGNVLTVGIITTLYVSVFPVLEIVEFIRKHNADVKIIIGGPFVSNQVRTLAGLELEYTLNSIGADVYVNSSQGETTLVNIIRALKENASLDRVNNIYYKTSEGYASTPLEIENTVLAENMVDWSLFADRTGRFTNVRTAISCPFSCSFCGFPEHAGKYQVTPVEAVEEELNRVQALGTVESVQFIDDTFNVPPKRFTEILKMLKRNRYSFSWHSHFRCQFATRETVELMKEAGCDGVFLGIESGSDQILRNMNKEATVEKYLKGVELLKEYDILTYGSFIIGFPGETEQTVAETEAFIRESGIQFFRTQLWYCDTMTPIWKQRDKYEIEGSHFEWKHRTMDSNTASDIVDRIFKTVEEPIWVPQYNFECDGIFHLLHRGLSLEQVKTFLTGFNKGVRENVHHLYSGTSSTPGSGDVSFQVLKELKQCTIDSPGAGNGGIAEPGASLGNREKDLSEDYEADFDF